MVAAVFFRSIRLHLSWWLQSFRPGGHPGVPLNGKRLLLIVGFPFFIALQLCHWLCLLLDELLFPAYRKTPVEAPVFITGVPRSGTTFLHRTLSADHAAFTTFKTWEVLLAPSILQRKLLHLLAAIDRNLGGWLRKTADALIERAAGDFNQVHEIGLNAAEEDYLTLLPAAGCFILVLAFPFRPELWALARLHQMKDVRVREQLLDFYTRCLQRHAYSEGKGRRLISKNAAFGSWAQALRQRFPDARLIACVREPESALSSQLSAIQGGLRSFGVDSAAAGIDHAFFKVYQDTYVHLRETQLNAPENRYAVVAMPDLKADPGKRLQAVLNQLELPLSPALRSALDAATEQARQHTSKHRHSSAQFNFARDEIDACMTPPYEAMLEHAKKAAQASASAPDTPLQD